MKEEKVVVTVVAVDKDGKTMDIIMITETTVKAALFEIPKRIIYFIQQDSFYIYYVENEQKQNVKSNHALTFISLKVQKR